MGVTGLKTFISQNKLLIPGYKVRETKLIIDANNLQGSLIIQDGDAFKFGGDMVFYREMLTTFIENLRDCKIEPIFVFDGAQTQNVNTSKTREKFKRCREKHKIALKVSSTGEGSFIPCPLATIILKSVLIDNKVRMVQAFYEADSEIARLANEYQCPVLSNDSDFFLVNLPQGVIPIEHFDFCTVKQDQSSGSYVPYILCKIFFQENIVKLFYNLNVSTLPLLGPLVGNDFVDRSYFESFCETLSMRAIQQSNARRRNLKAFTQNHERIIKVLSFLRGKSLNQAINEVCNTYATGRRKNLKSFLHEQVRVYLVDVEDCFQNNMYYYIVSKINISRDKRDEIIKICDWLQKACEETTIHSRSLEILVRNKLFFRGTISDLSLSSPISCFARVAGVLANFMRLSNKLNQPVHYYDRVGVEYQLVTQEPERIYVKEDGGPIRSVNLKLFDLKNVDEMLCKNIICDTFSTNYESRLKYCEYLRDLNVMPLSWVRNITSLRILFDYINNYSTSNLWAKFKQAVLIAYIYHMNLEHINNSSKEGLIAGFEFMDLIKSINHKYKLSSIPRTKEYTNHRFNVRIVHQISQLQVSIMAYETINGIFNTPFETLRPHLWFNSCFIYNLTRLLKVDKMSLPGMYRFIANDYIN